MNPNHAEFVRLAGKIGLRYLVIGGMAMKAHGIERNTHDLDIVIPRAREDAEKLLQVLSEMDSAYVANLTVDKLLAPKRQIPVAALDGHWLDILTTIDGFEFEPAWQRRRVGATPLLGPTANAPAASLEDLIAIKRTSLQAYSADASEPLWPQQQRDEAQAKVDRDKSDLALLEDLASVVRNGG